MCKLVQMGMDLYKHAKHLKDFRSTGLHVEFYGLSVEQNGH